MEEKFKVLISGRSRLLIRFIGHLIEGADLHPVRFSPRRPVEVDLSELESINSVGLREFANWSKTIKNKDFTFSHCPRVFIDQVNMIHGLLPEQAKITSFYVPFVAMKSNREQMILYRSGLEYKLEKGGVQLHHPEVKDETGDYYELDVIASKYFLFLQRFA
ncbi:MAG: STAS domain-containing protein [Bdellovibrionales bacterium]